MITQSTGKASLLNEQTTVAEHVKQISELEERCTLVFGFCRGGMSITLTTFTATAAFWIGGTMSKLPAIQSF